MYKRVEEWRAASSSPAAPLQPCPVPQVQGNPNTFISLRLAFRSIGIYCAIAYFLASVVATLDSSRPFGYPSDVLTPMAVCGVLALFMAWPRLSRRRLKS